MPAFIFIPTLYFSEGLVYILVNAVSVIMYKKMGASNTLIGLTSFLYLPWVIKMLWGPLVDGMGTKRNWIIATQAVVGTALMLAGFSVHLPAWFVVTLVFFVIAAFSSATLDIATDGFYMLALSEKKQAFYVGIRTLFYRLAMLFGTGGLVYLAGRIETRTGNIQLSWTAVLATAGGIYLLLALFHKFALPKPVIENTPKPSGIPFKEAFKTYFQQPGILPVLLFILFYRFGEAMLIKMIAPFLLDAADKGGLALATTQVGLVYGTVGIAFLVTGGILGGISISKFGLKKCLWPMALLLNLPALLYVYMAAVKPDLPFVYAIVSVEQFGYGFGTTALMVLMMKFAQGAYKTSHYAISTGIMAIGMMVPGLVSGYLQDHLGYTMFFTLTLLMGLPGIALLWFVKTEAPANAPPFPPSLAERGGRIEKNNPR